MYCWSEKENTITGLTLTWINRTDADNENIKTHLNKKMVQSIKHNSNNHQKSKKKKGNCSFIDVFLP